MFLHFIFLLPQFPHLSPSAPQHYDYIGLFIALTVLQQNRTAETNEYGELELKDFELAVRKKVLKNVLNCCQHVKTLWSKFHIVLWTDSTGKHCSRKQSLALDLYFLKVTHCLKLFWSGPSQWELVSIHAIVFSLKWGCCYCSCWCLCRIGWRRQCEWQTQFKSTQPSM